MRGIHAGVNDIGVNEHDSSDVLSLAGTHLQMKAIALNMGEHLLGNLNSAHKV